MTGEMSRSEVTRTNYPLHFAAARKFKGSVHPFDQYQGPYVFIPGRGRFWLCPNDEGTLWFWVEQNTEKQSCDFNPHIRGRSTRAFSSLMAGE